ncbi:methyltransferase domain-containing protein [Deinococcus altitudinis]|uniref:methyltransferase domain-containing protein n=1 Tax=Deinococcus altitudinis TaxID=468914 RepID=UPI003891D1B9
MWNPDVYRQFQAERDRPFFDLVAQLPVFQPVLVTDLGCGTAHQTATLAERWPQAQVTGVDSSAEMLEQAPALPNLRLVQADFSRWTPGAPQDLLFSNAALHWIPDQHALIPRLAGLVAAGGVFAFQVPGNFTAPSHLLLAELQNEPRWQGRLATEAGPASLNPLDYADLLTPLGFQVNAWETTYLHLLHGPDAALNWVRGTALRPVLARLSPGDAAEFEAEYGRRLRAAYPEGPSGTAFSFRRVFVVARRTS